MKNLFITLSLLISFVALLGSSAKADTTYVDLDTIVDYQVLSFCYDDTVYLYKSSVPNPDGFTHYSAGNPYGSTPAVILTESSVTYSNDSGSTWNTSYTSPNGLWKLSYNSIRYYSYIYFTDPATESFLADTLPICGSTHTLHASNKQDGMYYRWSEIGVGVIAESYYPSNDSLIEDHTGDFVLEEISGCNTFIDTIHLELTTTILPSFGITDTSFCGGTSVDYTMSLTEDYDDYLWSDGSTADTLHTTSAGTFSVTVNNACLTNETVSINVYHTVYPALDLGPDIVACGGTNVTLTTGFEYDLIQWKNAADSVTYPGGTDTSFTITNDMNILLRVRQGACPAMLDWIDITFTTPADYTQLCIATVDTNGLNKVVWNPYYSVGIESYNIYKQSGTNWIQVGNVLLDSVAAWGQTQFWDTTTDPEIQATSYAVSAIDTCGNESTLSPSHTTIRAFLTTEYGTGNPILNRTDYIVSDGSFTVTSYIVLVDSFANGNITQLDVFNGTNDTYSITNPYPGAKYYAGAGLPYACSGSKSITDLTGISISNPKVILTTGIKPNNGINLDISIYPNPSTGIFQIESRTQIEKIEVVNTIGQTILSTNTKTIDLSSFEKGIYFAKITTAYGPSIEKLILK